MGGSPAGPAHASCGGAQGHFGALGNKGMNEPITEEAWQWHEALQRDDADWEGFTRWLEADPAHRTAYDAVALLDDALTRQSARLAAVLPADGAEDGAQALRPVRRWGVWLGGAVAAALALVVAVPQVMPGAPATEEFATGTGETRPIRLADGSRITLGPSSRLSLTRGETTAIRLTGGAWFDIRHDPSRALSIDAGGQRISDIGTRFDILSLAGHVYVAVAEGQVSVGPAGAGAAPVKLGAGHSLAIDTRTNDAQMRTVMPNDVGSWRSGRLVYNDVPLALVAADLSRYGGRMVSVAPEVGDRRFSGILAVGKDANPAVELGDLMGLRAVPDGAGLRLAAGGR